MEGERLIQFARLATFPSQNPNPVIELDHLGHVTYLNPAAQARFPDLGTLEIRHPLLKDLPELIPQLSVDPRLSIDREVEFEGMTFAIRVCTVPNPPEVMVRVYAHDLSEARNAERANRELARRVVLSQEEERRRVSHDLHDEAGQALAALRISLELLKRDRRDLEAVLAGLDDAIHLVDETRTQIRRIAHGLRPPVLDALDLAASLEGFCNDFAARTGLAIDFEGSDIGDPADAVKVVLYRSLQEALANIAIHAGPTSVNVRLERITDRVRLTVTDHGMGFDASHRGEPSGRGLAWMAERAALLSGALTIESSPDCGTVLQLELPWATT